MKLIDVLEKYDTTTLDQISADKIDEAISLRLPQPVIVQEIISALSSQSYISSRILYGKPPMFAMLTLMLRSPGYVVNIDGFKAQTLSYVRILSEQAAQDRGQHHEKDPDLYVKILRRAWENDNMIDKSEANILELVRHELGIWDREHFVLMYDEHILSLWDLELEYLAARNHLLTTGIMLTYEDKYVIADEVVMQIRKTFGIEIMDDCYKRLLTSLSKEDLVQVLDHYRMNISGTKDLLADRLLGSLIPPADILDSLTLESLRDLCRREDIPMRGLKSAVISGIILFFDSGQDLLADQPVEHTTAVQSEPEPREMDGETYSKMLLSLTGQQLYDVLNQSELMTSGTKEEKVRRIIESYFSERTILNRLRKEDLTQLCRRFGLQLSGSKQELVTRLLGYVPTPVTGEPLTAPVEASIVISMPMAEQQSSPVLPDNEAALPANWEAINEKFSDFGYDEKIVLSVLMEARSITEQELQRIAAKYKLGWFLQKANMAELMARLKRDNKPYIQIKSIQSNNIYHWTGNDVPEAQTMEKKSARDIIDALRHGVVPRHNLDLLMVGQQTARRHLSEMLLEVNPHKSHFKFIRGQYGSGKTFLCSWLKEYALDHEYAVSFINISHDQPLSDLPIFFSGVINGLRTPEKTDSSALVDILESWLLNIHNKTAQIEGLDARQQGNQQKLIQIVERSIDAELAKLNDIEPGFAQAVRAFYDGKVTGNTELASNAVAWITGSRSLSGQALREIGVKGFLESNNVFPRMRALLEIISGARYKGLLLLVDELELVRKFPHARQREQALETLRLLIDEAGRNALPGCLLIFTGTDEFFEDERYGLRSYEALAERVMTPTIAGNFVSMRQPIISLESLDRQRLNQVLIKIRDLYSIAYSCDATQFATEEAIAGLVEEWTLFGEENVDRKPRPILREFIQQLDICEENKGVTLYQFLKKNHPEAPANSYQLN